MIFELMLNNKMGCPRILKKKRYACMQRYLDFLALFSPLGYLRCLFRWAICNYGRLHVTHHIVGGFSTILSLCKISNSFPFGVNLHDQTPPVFFPDRLTCPCSSPLGFTSDIHDSLSSITRHAVNRFEST